ncbi:MAG: hypothetical protein JNM80_06305 [Phycisphaerae bacterium]|nr:hypothetical protein [Phycisphaerae bacterium]
MFCFGCRYDLRSIAASRCPECGRAFDPADARTYSRAVRAEAPRWVLALGLVAAAWPLVTAATFLVTTLAARISLGHCPRPYLDDPRSINSAVVGVLAHAAIVAMIAMLPAALVALCVVAYLGALRRWRPAALVLLVGLAAWAGFVLLNRYDPLRCVDWLFD